MNRLLLSVFSVIIAAGSVLGSEYTVATREGELTTLTYQSLAASDASLVGASTVALDVNGPRWTASKGFGKGVLDGSRMGLDSSTNLNTMFEIFVSAAMVKLLQDTQFTTSLDDAISTTFTPNNIALVNPTTGSAITYRHVMQHTSTILDSNFASYTRTAPATVGTLDAFVEAYLTTGAGGVLRPTVFSAFEPGTVSAYSFARANIALLGYMVNRIISAQSLSYLGVDDYIYQNFIQPMGLSHTFFLQRDGTAAEIMTHLLFTGTFSGVTITDAANYAPYYQNSTADQLNILSPLIHPAFISDYMGYTTSNDIARMLYHFFMGGSTTWTTISNELKSLFQITQGLGRVSSQTGSGLGIMYFNGQTICDLATSTSIISSCPLTNLSGVYGYVTARDRVHTGFLCSDSTSIGKLCVATTLVYSTISSRDTTAFMTLSAAIFQDLAGTLLSSSSNVVLSAPEKDEWFGVYVFIGVYCTLVVVYATTKILIYWGLQVSIAANTNTGGAAQLATPKKNILE